MSDKARVFISCGQIKDANLDVITSENVNLTIPEFTVATATKEKLENMEFEPGSADSFKNRIFVVSASALYGLTQQSVKYGNHFVAS